MCCRCGCPQHTQACMPQITDRGLLALTAGCQSLRVLNLERLNKLTDASVVSLGFGCHKLRSLNLAGCVSRVESLTSCGVR